MQARFLERLPAHPRFLLWGAVMAACLLLVLAALQYRWTGEVSRAERDRLRASLLDSCRRFEEDFNSEFVRLFGFLQAGGMPRFAASPDAVGTRYETWRSAAPHAAMARNLYLWEDQRLLRFHPETATFENASWPAGWEPLRQRLDALPSMRRGPPRLRGGPVIDSAVPAVALPIAPAAGGARWAIIQIDREFVAQHYIPRLVGRHFGENYNVAVVARDDSAPLYAVRPEPRPPDAVVPLLQFPMGPGAERRPPPLAALPGQRARSPWLLHVWLTAGPPAEVVRRAQLRNLAVSLGVLLLLGSSIALLLVAARNAQRLARLQMDFVAGVSHELRTPLAVICSAGDNLADGVVTAADQVRRYGGVVRGEGRRLSLIVEQILRYTSLDRNAVPSEPVDVPAAIDAAIAANEADLEAAGMELHKQLSSGLPPVTAEPTSLVHCLSNLINNAAKHAGSGGWIGITAGPSDGGRVVSITVKDRGPGIAPSDLPYVFDAFYRGRPAISGQIRGLGLGLNLVKRIVEAHGGSVAVSSSHGAGSAFEIRLPAVRKEIG